MWGVVPVSFWNDRNKKISESHFKTKDFENKENTSSEIESVEPSHDHTENYINIDYDGTSLDNAEAIFIDPIKFPDKITNNDMFKVGLAVCHSLTILDGELTGDPLEVKVRYYEECQKYCQY